MDETFWESHGNEVEAAITLVIAVAIAWGIDRFAFGRAVKVTENMDTVQFSRAARTRLTLIRRLVFVGIIVIGLIAALGQFTEIRRLATGILASTAVLGLIVGFAARTVLANFVAGVLMAVRQPIRLGDLITIGEDVHGRVKDIALTFTSVDPGDGSLIIVPNEKVINDVVVNHSSGNSRAPATVEVWVPPEADMSAAHKALERDDITSVRLVELTHEGARLELKAPLEAGRNRDSREAEIREAAQAALREAGVLRAP
jgi:small-conductance mechanosensitive channel